LQAFLLIATDPHAHTFLGDRLIQTGERDLLDGLTGCHFENGCCFQAHVGQVVMIAAVP
jgi:hypothetical protein